MRGFYFCIMPLFALDKKLIFPPVHLAEPDGLLAMGGDLSRKDCYWHIAMEFSPGMKVIQFFGGAPTQDLCYFQEN